MARLSVLNIFQVGNSTVMWFSWSGWVIQVALVLTNTNTNLRHLITGSWESKMVAIWTLCIICPAKRGTKIGTKPWIQKYSVLTCMDRSWPELSWITSLPSNYLPATHQPASRHSPNTFEKTTTQPPDTHQREYYLNLYMGLWHEKQTFLYTDICQNIFCSLFAFHFLTSKNLRGKL